VLEDRIPLIVSRASLQTQRAVDEAGQEIEFHAAQAAGLRRITGTEQRAIRWKVNRRDPYSGRVSAGAFYTRFSEYGTIHQSAVPILGPAAEAVDQSFVVAVTAAWRHA
jgi:hypothetical protein